MKPLPADALRGWATWLDRVLADAQNSGDLDTVRWACEEVPGQIDRSEPDPYLPYLSRRLSVAFMLVAEHDGDPSRWDDAVNAARWAADRVPTNDPSRYNYFSCLADCYAGRHEVTASDLDLKQAERWYRAAIDAAPSPSARVTVYGNFSTLLHTIYQRNKDAGTLDEAIRLARAVATSGLGEKNYTLFQLGNVLHEKYLLTGDDALLEEAMASLWAALRHTGPSERGRGFFLTFLAHLLDESFERTGHQETLVEAGSCLDQALRLMPPGHMHRPGTLTQASNLAMQEYHWSGDVGALQRTIAYRREALEATEPTEISYPAYSANLAEALREQHSRLGGAALLDEAIALYEQTLIHERGGSRESMYLSLLSAAVLDRAELNRFDRDDPDHEWGLLLARQALAGTPPGSPGKGALVNNLAVALLQTGSKTARDEAEQLCRDFLATPPPKVSMQLSVQTSLADALEATGIPQDLAEAESLLRSVMGASLPTEKVHYRALVNLCQLLGKPTVAGRDPAARAAAVAAAKALLDSARVTIAHQVHAYRTLGLLATETGDWVAAAAWHRSAIELMAVAAPATWTRTDRRYGLTRFNGLARDGAACALNAVDEELAVELLDRGRGVLMDHGTRRNRDLGELRRHAPELARKLDYLLDQAAVASTTVDAAAQPWSGVDRALRREHLREELDVLVTRIREVPPLARFGRGLTAAQILRHVGDRCVVLINVSRIRCDAILIHAGELQILPLPGLTADLVDEQYLRFEHGRHTLLRNAAWYDDAAADVHGVLEWLWEAVAAPVLTELGVLDHLPSAPSRVWWCPTGILAAMPVHAAGRYRRRRPDDNYSVHDHVTSSYLPTVTALPAGPAPTRPDPSALVVGMARTPGLSALPGAGQEAAAVAAQLTGSTLLVDERATRANILRGLASHPWLHFAGHGFHDSVTMGDPVLFQHDHQENYPISADDLADSSSHHDAELAFLSACETATGHIGLPDEPTHLAAAVQAAGFIHCIATLWRIPDAATQQLAIDFYELLLDPRTAGEPARALHLAVARARSLRSATDTQQLARDVLRWAAFVHFGA